MIAYCRVVSAVVVMPLLGCATPTLGAEQRMGVAGLGAAQGHPTAFVTRTAVALGVVPREGACVAAHVEMSSGYDAVRGADHGVLVMLGRSWQPSRIDQRVGLEILGEFGGPVLGAPAGEFIDLGARGIVSLHLSRRTIDERNRVYSLVLRNVMLTLSVRGGARIDTGLTSGGSVSASGYMEAGVGIRFQLGTDLQ